MEDVSEDAVIDNIFFVILWFDQVAHIMVEEPQLTAQIGADGSRTDAAVLLGKKVLHDTHHLVGLEDSLRMSGCRELSCLQRTVQDGLLALHHLL